MALPAGALEVARGVSSDGARVRKGRAGGLPRPSLVAALLALALALAATLYGTVVGGRSTARHSTTRHSSRAHDAARSEGLFSLPGAAQGPVSNALGAESSAYRIRARTDRLTASSPAQRLALRFDRAGAFITAGSTSVGLSLRSVGFGSALRPVGAVAPRAQRNRVLFEHPGLSEWYANGPLGLEQGFTFASAPGGRASGPLTLSLALSGTALPSLTAGGKGVMLHRAGGPTLRYVGLAATDARGRSLHSWLVLDGQRLLVRVDARGARYPLRIDPFIQQGPKLTGGTERGEEGSFGFSVALNAEATTALIGGPHDNGRTGAAWVFTRSGEKWTQQGSKLTGRGESGAGEFGYSVAVSPEGNTALIGGPMDDERAGAVWAFTRSGEKWTQQGSKLMGREEVGKSQFGYSVALASKEKEEGVTAVIGGPSDGKEVEVEKVKRVEEGYGAVWVFTRSGENWAQQGTKLTPGTGEELGRGEFGRNVALSSKEGNTALIGAPRDGKEFEVEKVKKIEEGYGAAWVFTRSGSTWQRQAMIAPTSGEEAGTGEFGASVAISSKEGNTALVGAPNDKEGAGGAWVFTRSGSTWSQQGAKLTPKEKEEVGAGSFGYSVALAAKEKEEGSYALITASLDSGGLGAAWVFTRSGSTWTQQGAKLTAKSGEEIGSGHFGAAAALSAEANYALMGAPYDREGVGAAWVFSRAGSSWSQLGPKLTGSGELGEGESSGKGELGYSVALSSDGNTALLGGPGDNFHVGAAWVFTRTGSTWSQQAKLTAKSGEETGAAELGYSVALASSGGNYAIVGAPQDNGGVGAAWVFVRSGSTWTQQGGKLTGSGELGKKPEFARSVALSSEGTNALIGAPGDGAEVEKQVVEKHGSAFVFTRSGEKWTQQGSRLTGSGEVGEGEFGISVGLSSKGEYALIGAPVDTFYTGAAWVFTRSGETWTQQAKLTSKENERSGVAGFGQSVAISAEGNYALIGAPYEREQQGSAWVFNRSGSTWTQQGAKLTPKEKEEIGGGHFGWSVALSSGKEGSYALIGAPVDNIDTGGAWVFNRSGSTWTQQGSKLTGGVEVGTGEFAESVALSSEEATTPSALMGGPRDNKSIGAAWAFTRAGSTWTEQGEKLTASSELGEGEFGGKGEVGYSVAISAEGNTALVGGRATLGNTGAVWVFTRSGEKWTQQGEKLTASGESGGAEFGSSVALSSEGNTALIGGPGYKGGSEGKERVGAAWVFTRSGEKWTQQGEKLIGGAESHGGEFGSSVALSAEGNTALIGGPNDGPFKAGASWAFTRSGETWTQQGEKLGVGGLSAEAFFGTAVALSADGNTALIGAPGQTSGAGGAWVLTRSGSTWTVQGEKLSGGGESGAGGFGRAVALGGGGNTALIGAPADNKETGAAWVFTRASEKWTQQGEKLTGAGESAPARFGASVALSANTGSTALIGAPANHESLGAVWVFARSSEKWTERGKLTGSGGIGPAQFGSSVAVSAEGTTAVIGGSADNGRVGASWAFFNAPPTVATEEATSITQTTAKLNATVNPNGDEVSECTLEYGLTTSYGSSAPCTPAPGSGTGAVEVHAEVTGLGGNSTYHYRVVAASYGGTSKGKDTTLTTSLGAPIDETRPAEQITQTTATMNATVNPEGSEVTECKFEYGTTESYGASTSCTLLPGSGISAVAVSAPLSGLSAHTTYHYRIVAKSAGGTSHGADQSFKTPVNPPTVETKSAEQITQSSATVTATVNPNAGEVTECKFEYGTSESYGSTAACSPSPGSGEKAVAVSAALSALSENTTYHYRIVATNSSGTSRGSDGTFKTKAAAKAPSVGPEGAIEFTQTSATLTGAVRPNGSEVTECKFEYGKTTAYGSSAPCVPMPGSGEKFVEVTAAVSGLVPNSTYHYRISATNAGGTSKSTDETFQTLPQAPSAETKPAWSVRSSSALLKATVNPNGGNVTECKFEYGETITYIFTAPCSALPGAGESAVTVSATLSGLSPSTTYHYRVSVTNAGGTSLGADREFTTQPTPVARHWYKSGSIAKAGATIPVVLWGGTANIALTSSAGEINCLAVGGGEVQNPSGGGAGTGEITALDFYSCKAPQCEASVKEKFGTQGRGYAVAQNLPWSSEVFAGGSPLYDRERIGEPFALPFGSPKAGEVKIATTCEVASTHAVFARSVFEGEMQPEIGVSAENLNGLSAGKPSTARFAEASTGTVYSEASGEGIFTGGLKYLGYNAQEVMSVQE